MMIGIDKKGVFGNEIKMYNWLENKERNIKSLCNFELLMYVCILIVLI